MAYNGSGVYSLPPGSTIANGDTSDATDLNTPLADLETAQNTARPVVAGGTGATTASGARTNLGLGAAAVKGVTGADSAAVTGTAGASGTYAQWNADGDLVAATIAQTKAATGYTTLPGGVIIQWTVAGPAGTGLTASPTFPVTFPTAVVSAQLQYTNTSSAASAGDNYIAQITAISTSGLTFKNLGPDSAQYYLTVIGY